VFRQSGPKFLKIVREAEQEAVLLIDSLDRDFRCLLCVIRQVLSESALGTGLPRERQMSGGPRQPNVPAYPVRCCQSAPYSSLPSLNAVW